MYVGTEMRLEALGVDGARRHARAIQEDIDCATNVKNVLELQSDRKELDQKIDVMRTNLALAEFYIDAKEASIPVPA